MATLAFLPMGILPYPILLLPILVQGQQATESRLDRDSAIGRATPLEVARTLDVRDVGYLGFDGRTHQGQIVCAKPVCDELVQWFSELETAKFPLRSVKPISVFGGSDSASMAADNTYCFAHRGIWGSRRLSWHASGRAIDINPQENPAFKRGTVTPAGARLDHAVPGTLSDTSVAVRRLKARGWHWGAHWRRVQDWQHFEKPQ